MRKLILTSFTFKTGEIQNEEKRLVVVTQNQSNTQHDLLTKAIENLSVWFKRRYPESELLAVIPHDTIGDEAPEENPLESYTRRGLVEFGQYLLSQERTKRIKDNRAEDDPISLEERLKDVYHADIENWLSAK